MVGVALVVLTYAYLRKGEAHDYRTAPGADPLHREFSTEPDGRSSPEPEGARTVRR